MPSLRRRFQLATSALVALQLGATALVAGTWRGAVQASTQERQISTYRAEVDALSLALREQYVHEAHTYIEGGTGHLAHGAQAEADLDARFATVQALPLPKEAAPQVAKLREAMKQGRAHFREKAVPLAEVGALDRSSAAILHAQTEEYASRAEAACAEIDALLEQEQAEQRAAVERRSSTATALSVGLALSALGTAAALTRRLAGSVLGPLQELSAAALAFGAGQSARAPETGDEEIAALGKSFNAMTEQVRDSEKRRVDAERLAALGEMSAAVAHELMSPLTVILGHPEARALEPVRKEAEHASRVVRSLLGFARPSEEQPVELDLAKALQEAAERAQLFSDSAQVRVLGGDGRAMLPPSAARQVLDNLLSNALAASQGEVELALLPGPVIEVRDRGPGIPPALRPRLYTPFATGRSGGTGLGLAVSLRIAQASGGTLEHLDREGGGTVARWRIGG